MVSNYLEGVMNQTNAETLRAQFELKLAETELRMTKFTFASAIGVFALCALLVLPFSPLAGALFVAGSAVQMYAVSQI